MATLITLDPINGLRTIFKKNPGDIVTLNISGTYIDQELQNGQVTVTDISVQIKDLPAVEATLDQAGKTWSCVQQITLVGAFGVTVSYNKKMTTTGAPSWADAYLPGDPIQGSVQVVADPNPPQLSVVFPQKVTEAPDFECHVKIRAKDSATDLVTIQSSVDNGPFERIWGGNQLPNHTLEWIQNIRIPHTIGKHNIRIQAIDHMGNVAEQSGWVEAIDNVPPVIELLNLNTKRENLIVAQTEITVLGKTTDSQSGMIGGQAKVYCALNSTQNYLPATPGAADDWRNWSATIPISDYGQYTLFVMAVDRDGNERTLSVALNVISSYKPKNLDDRLSRRAYLEDLLKFARDHVYSIEGGSGIMNPEEEWKDSLKLQNLLYLPLNKLSQPLNSAAELPVNQTRLAIELLQQYMKKELDIVGGIWQIQKMEEYKSKYYLHDLRGLSSDLEIPESIIGDNKSAKKLADALNFSPNSGFEIPDAPHLRIGQNNADFTVTFHLHLTKSYNDDTWYTILRKGNPKEGIQRTPGIWLIPNTTQLHVRVSCDHPLTSSQNNLWNEGIDRSALSLELRRWYHIAVVKKGQELILYIDGQLDSRAELTKGTVAFSEPIILGADGSTGPGFAGAIKNLAVLHCALSQQNIQLMTAGTLDVISETSAANQEKYCRQSYEMILSSLGTSYEEMRLLRKGGADDAKRAAFAQRLGIPLSLGQPKDELDELLLEPTELTENNLQAYFGIRSFAHDPFEPIGDPLFLCWRKLYQRNIWQKEDNAYGSVLIDPDIQDENDLGGAFPFNIAIKVLRERTAQLLRIYIDLKQLREGKSTPSEAFESLIQMILPKLHLFDLQQQETLGQPIEGQLASYFLERRKYNYLVKVQQLTQTGIVTPEEWEDLYHILVSVAKHQLLDTWKAEEINIGICQNDEFFKISDQDKTINPWRASQLQRMQWQDRLNLRIEQEKSLDDNYAAILREVEATVLPVLRDGLLKQAAGLLDIDVDSLSEKLTERFFIDMKGDSRLVTSRSEQAIETLQNLIFSVRVGRIPDWHPARNWEVVKIEVDEVGFKQSDYQFFDLEWRTIGSYEGWRAAMGMYLFPENYLQAGTIDIANQIGPLIDLIAQTPLNSLAKAITNAGWPKKNTGNQTWSEIEYHVIQPVLIAEAFRKGRRYTEALDWYRKVYDYEKPPDSRKNDYLKKEINGIPNFSRGRHWARTDLSPHTLAWWTRTGCNYYTRYSIMAVVRCLMEYADTEFARDSIESVARARSLYLTARDLLNEPDFALPGTQRITLQDTLDNSSPQSAEPMLPNPVLDMLRDKVRLQLSKIRQGRNIAGMKRELELPRYSGLDESFVAADTVSVTFQPTAYRFHTLIERSKQWAELANRFEIAYLNALEKKENKAHEYFEALKVLGLVKAKLSVSEKQIQEARQGENLSVRQKERSDVLKSEYTARISAGLNGYENAMLEDYQAMHVIKDIIAVTNASNATAQIAASASSWTNAIGTWGVSIIAGAQEQLGVLEIMGQTMLMNICEENLQKNSLMASQERRREEWQLQAVMAGQDSLIAGEQILLSVAHTAVVLEERKVAELEARQAEETLHFLANQQLNEEMYEWMSGVLGSIYAYFLQQTTGIAKTAQYQLAFERQSPIPYFIQSDYWALPEKISSSGANTGDGSKNRLGLMGAELLLRDINQLDQYAFETDKRKLNLTQAFSLEQLFPVEFREFRKTGILRFRTPSILFDRDFPGHYLRLLKRVRINVAALIPPNRGIRASLSASGISRVVVQGRTFQETTIRREPEYVALTSPIGANGVFELDVQSELLQPFEGSGVDTAWELLLPKASNPFDFNTIADVLLTMEFTALNSNDYRQQVIKTLRNDIQADRMYSIKDQFPDEWYDLNNSDLVEDDRKLVVTFQTRPEDFPSNVEVRFIQELVLYFIFKNNVFFDVPVTLSFNNDTGVLLYTNKDTGILSTRSGASSWKTALQIGKDNSKNKLPFGEWKIKFGGEVSSPEEKPRLNNALNSMKTALASGDLEDILFVVTYAGKTPEWV